MLSKLYQLTCEISNQDYKVYSKHRQNIKGDSFNIIWYWKLFF